MKHGLRRRLALFAVAVGVAGTAQAQVVISQVYGGGGNSGAPLRSDFVELHNTSATAVSVDGWSLQYASATGSSWQRTDLTGSIPAGGYYLVKQADGANTAAPALPAPDASGTIAMAAGAGKVALVASTTALGVACPTGSVDFVGYGSTANCAEGSAPTATLSATLAALRAGDGCTDSNSNGADFATAAPAPRNGAAPALLCGGGNQPLLSVADISQDESGSFVFTFSLNQPAGAGGVRVDYASADGSALAGSDYSAVSGTLEIAEGQSSATLAVEVIDDAVTESDETFTLQLSNPVGALPGRDHATATLVNDDVSLTAIHAIQGSGGSSPLAGQLVYTTGIVTGRKGNGFFLQARDADADSDAATSEGVYVFTGAAPPAAAAVGNEVRVGGTVIEYVPSADPYQLPLTEIGGTPSVALLSSGNPLPAPVPLGPDFPSASGGPEQLERLEGMRVSAANLTVVAPTQGNTSESSASGSSNGILFAVVSGVPRPFREPGVQVPDPVPSADIPRWDANPELITVDSDTLGGNAYTLDLAAGATIAGLTGPLDYGFRRYTLHRDPAVAIDVVAGPAPSAARLPNADEFTVAGYNLERFFDTANDPAIGEPVLTVAAFERRLAKASLTVRDYLHAPDILATVEMENLSTLQALAARINVDAVAAGQPDPRYAAHLQEGNDVGGIDVGFLVKGAEVATGIARVDVLGVTQHGKDLTWTEPDGSVSLLNDRPPLALDALVHYADGRSFPITVIAVHQRSLNGADTADAAGDRVRQKRQRQAEYLASLVQQMQTENPARRIALLGDFNAFEFNDGYVDAMNVVTGTPTADAQTVVAGDGADLVDPDLVNLGQLEAPGQHYSFVFEGNAQTLDHVLANEELLLASTGFGIDHARVNADFPEVARNDANSPSRLSDHDPLVAYFELRPRADLAVAVHADDDRVETGATLSWQAQLRNLGPQAAAHSGVGFAVDAELPGLQVTAPASWSCDTPQVAAGMTSVACTAATLDNGAMADFGLRAPALAALAERRVTLAVAASTQSFDPQGGNDHAEAGIDVAAPQADPAVSLDGPAQIDRRSPWVDYTATVANLGTLSAHQPVVEFSVNTLSFASRISAPEWDCRRELRRVHAVVIRCSRTTLEPGASTRLALRVHARPTPANGVVSVVATVQAEGRDGDAGNNTAQFDTAVR